MNDEDHNRDNETEFSNDQVPEHVPFSGELEEDGNRPFDTADDVETRAPIDHPLTDAEIDEHEAYDVGTDEASGYSNK